MGKYKGSKIIIILVTLFIIAAMGVVATQAYTSAEKKAVSSNIEADNPTAVNKPVKTITDTQGVKPSDGFEITDNISKVILRVDGMSCSGCIYTIKSSIAGLNGIRDILVDLSAGQTEVYYDSMQLKDVNRIADAVTGSGYPAKIVAILTADQIKKERDLTATRSLNYIASVGEWDISKNDFNAELEHAKSMYVSIYGNDVLTSDRGKALMDNFKVQIVSRLINEGIQMQEIRKSGYTVGATTVDEAFGKLLNKKGLDLNKFKSDLEKNGYAFDYFMKKFETRVMINTYIEDKVFNGTTNDFEKQRLYTSWFNNARLLSKIVYYDKKIERLIQSQAAGGGCSGGSSCRKNS